MTTVDAAINYADLGYSIFPIVPGAKRPLTKNGLLDATTDGEQIERWWTDHPTANIALRTDGLLVVDIDPDSAGNPNPWLIRDEEKLRSLAVAPISLTPRGGKHFIFRQPAGGGFRNTASKIAPNVDTRADGGYVVIPPSVLEGGRVYQWACDLALDMPPTQLPEPPDWLVRLLWQEYSGEAVRQNEPTPGNAIPSGQRNSALTSLGGVMRRVGMPEGEIRAALSVANATRCSPPLPQTEVDTIAWSVCRYAPDGIATAVAENHAAQDADLDDLTGPADPGSFPVELLNVPGFIGDVCRYCMSTAFKPQPALSLAAALSLMAVLTGRKVQDRYGTRTNLYAIGVCGTSTGKERPREVNKDILAAADCGALIGPESIGSSAGLENVVAEQLAILFQIDEMGRYLATLGDAKQSHLYNILTVLMKMFTSSGSIYIGPAYADTKRVKRLNQPHACIYGTTTPDAFYASLTTASLSDGFLSRVLVFEGDPEPGKQDAIKRPIPADLVEFARAWRGLPEPTGSLEGVNLGLVSTACIRTVEMDHLAATVFTELDEYSDAERKRLGEQLGSLWPRATEKARKLALLWACSESHEAPKVSPEAAQWACDVVKYLTRRLAYLASRWLSENRQESNSKRLARLIEAAGVDGITRSQLVGKTRWLSTRDRKEVLDGLAESGEVLIETVKTATRSRLVYRHRATG